MDMLEGIKVQAVENLEDLRGRIEAKVLEEDLGCGICTMVSPRGMVRCGNEHCKVCMCFSCWCAVQDKFLATRDSIFTVVLDPLDLRLGIPVAPCHWCFGDHMGVVVDAATSAQRSLRFSQLKLCDPKYEEMKEEFLRGHATDLAWFQDEKTPLVAALTECTSILAVKMSRLREGEDYVFRAWARRVGQRILKIRQNTVQLLCPYRQVWCSLGDIREYHRKQVKARELVTFRPVSRSDSDGVMSVRWMCVKYWLICVLALFGIKKHVSVQVMEDETVSYNGEAVEDVLKAFLVKEYGKDTDAYTTLCDLRNALHFHSVPRDSSDGSSTSGDDE